MLLKVRALNTNCILPVEESSPGCTILTLSNTVKTQMLQMSEEPRETQSSALIANLAPRDSRGAGCRALIYSVNTHTSREMIRSFSERVAGS